MTVGGFVNAWQLGYFQMGGGTGPSDVDDDGSPMDEMLKVGTRIKQSFGVPAKWYGGVVVEAEEEDILIAYDDGEAKTFSRDVDIVGVLRALHW